MIALYTTLIYQPFFNLLVAVYAGLLRIPNNSYADMGVAVIIFTLVLRVILLPLSIASHRSVSERKQIEEDIKKIKQQHHSDPVKQKQLIRKLFLGNRRVIFSEAFNFAIQVIIFLMLFRIFSKGLLGADIHLLYDIIPDVPQPYNLTFLGKFDLTKPSLFLNLVQSLVIFAVELVSTLTSPFPSTKKEVIRLQLILPAVSFLIFMNLPAGKKLFVITTLTFSFFFILLRAIIRATSRPTPVVAREEKTSD